MPSCGTRTSLTALRPVATDEPLAAHDSAAAATRIRQSAFIVHHDKIIGRRSYKGTAARPYSDDLPANEAVGVFDDDDIVFVEHRQQDVLQLRLEELSFVELCLHRFARTKIREAAHEEE